MTTRDQVKNALSASMADPDSVPTRIAFHAILPGAAGWDAAEHHQLRQELSAYERVFLDASCELLDVKDRMALQPLREVLVGDVTRERRGQMLMELREIWCDSRLRAPFDMSRFVGGKTDA